MKASTITNVELAMLWERQWMPAPGIYHAPAAVVAWDGLGCQCNLTGLPLDAAAAVISPDLAETLAMHQAAAVALPAEPTIEALLDDYDAAMAPFRANAVTVAAEGIFRARLQEGCRKCKLWKEADREGRGRCDSVRCACTKRLLWLAGEQCPESLWPA